MSFTSTWSPNFDCLVRAGDQGRALGNNTLACWARFDNLSAAYEVIEINGNGYSFGSAIFLNGTDVEYSQRSSSAQINKLGGQTLSANTWYHFALTYDGTTMRCYLNGAEIQTSTGLTGTRGNWWDLQVGPSLGQLQDAVFYDAALSAAEILALYACRLPKRRTNLIHHLPLFNGAAARRVDYSGNALNFSDSGTPTDGTSSPPVGWGGATQLIILPAGSAGQITADGLTQVTGTASVTRTQNFTAAGLTQVTGTAAVTGALAPTGSTQVTGTASMGIAYSISAAGLTQTTGTATEAINYALTATGTTQVFGQAAVAGGGGTISGSRQGYRRRFAGHGLSRRGIR